MSHRKLIYSIKNEEYKFSPKEFEPINGYLIVGVKNDKAIINHIGENIMSHDKAISWYNSQNIKVKRIYTGGQIIKISELKNRLNQKPINEVLGELENILLKK